MDIHLGRWWPALVGLDISCLAIGSSVSVLFVAPHWLRTEAHGRAGRYIALGAGRQAFIYLTLVARSGWLAMQPPPTERAPLPAWSPDQPRRGHRSAARLVAGPAPARTPIRCPGRQLALAGPAPGTPWAAATRRGYPGRAAPGPARPEGQDTGGAR